MTCFLFWTLQPCPPEIFSLPLPSPPPIHLGRPQRKQVGAAAWKTCLYGCPLTARIAWLSQTEDTIKSIQRKPVRGQTEEIEGPRKQKVESVREWMGSIFQAKVLPASQKKGALLDAEDRAPPGRKLSWTSSKEWGGLRSRSFC